MSGGIQLIAMEILVTTEPSILMKMGIGITFVDGIIHPVQ